MIVRFLTGPGVPGTIWPVAIHDDWDAAIGAVAALGGFVMPMAEKRRKEIVEKVGLCHACGEPSQHNSWLCEQCERILIEPQKVDWLAFERPGGTKENG